MKKQKGCIYIAMLRQLSTLEAGRSAVIREVGGDGMLRRRLLELGLLPGTAVSVRKRAPFGDPILLRLRGFDLTLRASEAEKIRVEVQAP